MKRASRENHIPNRIIERLQQYCVLPALESLYKLGADKQTILQLLEALAFPPPKRKPLHGVSRRQAQSLASTIRHIAGMMERLGTDCSGFKQPRTFREYEPYLQRRGRECLPEFHSFLRKGWLDGFAKYLKTPRDWHELILLPQVLRDYAYGLDSSLDYVRSLRKHPFRTSALCQLVWHVKKTTRDWRDPKIAQLVNAAEKRSESNPYTEKAHAKWRERNKVLIDQLGPLIEISPFPVFPIFLPTR